MWIGGGIVAKDGFDMDEMVKFEKQMLNLIEEQMPKACKGFLKRRAKELKIKVSDLAETVVGEKTGNYKEGFKSGKQIYEYGDVKYNIRVYNKSRHAHLVEYGHMQVVRGKPVGFTKGKHILEKASKEYEEKFFKNTEKFFNNSLKKGLHY